MEALWAERTACSEVGVSVVMTEIGKVAWSVGLLVVKMVSTVVASRAASRVEKRERLKAGGWAVSMGD